MMETLVEAERALTHGLVDKAERLYRQVRENDPKSSIAVMGLARVALERGDDATAYLHAKAALAIDADNPAAKHLVMRLAEVMEGRGEAPPDDAASVEDTAAPAPGGGGPADAAAGTSVPAATAQLSTPSSSVSSSASPTRSSRPSFTERLLRRRLKRPK